MLDVIIAGAGPAGSVAATLLARAGARVLIVDRETFPRDKLCGDTLNPGVVKLLQSIDLWGGPLASAPLLAGMVLTGPTERVEGRYGDGLAGRAITRRELDAWLLDQAIAAGARFEAGEIVRGPLIDTSHASTVVRGLVLARRGQSSQTTRVPAAMTLAADGRRSVLARALGLSRHPKRPRRWAFGVYATGIEGLTDVGEMHIRPAAYLGIAPIGGGVANVCAVTGPRPAGPTPEDVVRQAIARDPAIAARFAHATFVSPVSVLGPLAVETSAPGVDGMLLAGDAAGFVDPMTGDGLHLAIRGSMLAVREIDSVLQAGVFDGAVARLAEARRKALGGKVRFNRFVRALVEESWAIRLAEGAAAVAPGIIRHAVRYAGDAA
ncbi:MAG TPA: NAD(P)/FAD-dependent oxidoreductase [Vicinamibacterales bacterium]|nr:NAD(P)/FAD-dependent oxidoreductase [Vicinamibacterales bacterium]